jgi:hypothetical protein
VPYGPSRRRRTTGFLAALLCATVAAGAFLFLDLVLARGDVYPPYSTFRSDPLGTRALFEALGEQPGLDVRRLLSPPPVGPDAGSAVVFVVGLPVEAFAATARAEIEEAEAFLRAGGRLVLALRPDVAADVPKATPGGKKGSAPRPRPAVDLPDRWGIAVRVAESAPVTAARREPGADAPGRPLPPVLSWRSGVRLELRSGQWTTLYAVDRSPVVASRPFGRGTLVLLTDASLLTNGAMRKERATAFLAHLAGEKTTVLFDETHLGVEEREGLMTLIRRHRLGGFLLAALLVAGLWTWRNATGLLPPQEDSAALPRASGRDSFEGLVRLLARGIPPSRLLGAALAEWSRTSGAPTAEMRHLADETRRAADVPATYAALCRAAHTDPHARKEPHA